MEKQKRDRKEPEEYQTYKFCDTVFKVEPVFKKDGSRTLLHSLGKMIEKGINDIQTLCGSHSITVLFI